MAKVKVSGLRTVEQAIGRFVQQGNAAVADEVQIAGNLLLEQAQENIRSFSEGNPDYTGALASSGTVAVAARRAGFGDIIEANVRFGGKPGKRKGFWEGDRKNLDRNGLVDYAAAYHEITNPYLLKASREVDSEILDGIRKRFKILARKDGGPAEVPTTPGVTQSRDV